MDIRFKGKFILREGDLMVAKAEEYFTTKDAEKYMYNRLVELGLIFDSKDEAERTRHLILAELLRLRLESSRR